MMISPALAAHGVTDTGSSGGGTALLIIIAAAILFAVVFVGQKKWRRRMQGRNRGSK